MIRNISTRSAVVTSLLVLLSGCGADTAPLQDIKTQTSVVGGHSIDRQKQRISSNTNKLSPFLAGVLARNDSQYDNSAAYFAEALSLDPDSPFLKENAFTSYFNAGDYEKATEFAPELAAGSDNELLHILIAADSIKKQKSELALAQLEKAPKKGYGFIIYPVMKAWASAQNGDKEQAYSHLQEMSRSQSLKIIALELSAYVADYLGDVTKAKSLYNQLLNDPSSKSFQVVVAYASFLKRHGTPEDIVKMISLAVKRFPNNPYLSGDGRFLIQGAQKIPLFIDPIGGVSNVFVMLARDLKNYQNKQMALAFFNLAIFLGGANSDLVLQQAQLLMDLKDYSSAEKKYALIPQSSRYSQLAFMGRVRALFSGERDQEALVLLNEKLLKYPNNISILGQLADYHRGQQSYAKALEFYNRILAQRLSSAEGDWYYYFARGISYEQLKMWPEAEADLLYALKLSPKQADVLNYLGYSWVDRKLNMIKAREMIEEAASLSPKNGFIIDSLGWVYYLTGQYTKAVKTLEKAVLLEPGDATLHEHLGDAYWKVGRHIEARFQWKHALNADPDEEQIKTIAVKLTEGIS
ncbi:tetratricopeptide repeat protein [Temperatibacter marinus]|uniref:Tetratricopeptide repeat protein n=1 Tax=Temperatibacter marinus TaxID=1456591 RepID=A0AA52EGB2_9PROT|nr:tetratricopeptide repeat protein [Temperatibacter marinus]WND02007.1 tetratricopeptide repeat protein [Temperatibacter marinus]